MAYEIFRPMTPASFKFRMGMYGPDTDFVNKYQPIWTPYTPLAVLPTPLGEFTNYEMTEFTSGCNAPRLTGDSIIYQEVPLGDFNDWLGKGPFPAGGFGGPSAGSMDFEFTTRYFDGDPPGQTVDVVIDTYECSNNHRPWIGQTVTFRAKVKTDIWVDYEITGTSNRDIEYVHECVSGDFASSPVGDGGDGYYAGSPGHFRQTIEDVDFLEQSVVDGTGTDENFDGLTIANSYYPLEYTRTAYFAVEE